jgi:hypothetical protein
LVLSLAVAGGVLVYLLFSGSKGPSRDEEKRPSPPEDVVQIAGPQTIKVRSGTPLDAKLTVASVETASLTAPVLPVTGMSMASLRPAKGSLPAAAAGTAGIAIGPSATDRLTAPATFSLERGDAKDLWQFASPDLLSAFTDWEKAVVDVQFQKKQLDAVRELSDYRVEAQKEVVQRMEKLMAAGTERLKDVIAERVTLKQNEIQGKKDIHEAENNVKVAQKTETALARQLQQAGLEPTLLRSAAAEGDIVVAEVPERVVSRVRTGMTCEVRFYALPNRVFTGKVSSISPVISKDKRVLNVQFIVKDPENVLRTGMFAEIGLGTDERRALLMPADGVLHIGDKDYALSAGAAGGWQINEVETGALRGSKVEVLSGLKAGDRVLGKGAILLKPVVVQALQLPLTSPAGVQVTVGEKGANP